MEAGDSPEVTEERQENGTIDDGLAAFNHSVKVNVRDQLPTTGIRSWCIIGYKAAVLVGALASLQYRALCDFHDFWAWRQTGDSGVFFGIQNPLINEFLSKWVVCLLSTKNILSNKK